MPPLAYLQSRNQYAPMRNGLNFALIALGVKACQATRAGAPRSRAPELRQTTKPLPVLISYGLPGPWLIGGNTLAHSAASISSGLALRRCGFVIFSSSDETEQFV